MRILFVCYGNICRSPMAEYVLRYLVRERGLEDEIVVSSAATSTVSVGRGPSRGTREALAAHHIPCGNHRSRQLRHADAGAYDLIVGMDHQNLLEMRLILGRASRDKMHLMLDWSAEPRDVADPWYTGDYEQTFKDVWEGCTTLLDHLGAFERQA